MNLHLSANPQTVAEPSSHDQAYRILYKKIKFKREESP